MRSDLGARDRWRAAGPDDLAALLAVERAANLVGLAHVFPPERFPYPEADVLARWAIVVADPGVRVEVVPDPGTAGALVAFAAWDATTLRHLGVDPRRWGSGLARAGVERAVAGIAAGGADRALLWCLAANHRARGLYEHLGWRATGAERPAVFAPYPVELEYSLPLA